jgi:hypothetical protein
MFGKYRRALTKINYSFPPKTIVFLRKTIVFGGIL